MDDLISRRAAIDTIVNTPTDVYSHDRIVSVLDGAAFRQNEIIDIINALPSAQQWIPIEDRAPEFGKDVLISHRGFVSIDWLTQSEGDAYFFASRAAIADIDAWMPLPMPFPEGEEDEND